MDHLKFMRQALRDMLYTQLIGQTYPRWFGYTDAKTGRKFCDMSISLRAAQRNYYWHLRRWLNQKKPPHNCLYHIEAICATCVHDGKDCNCEQCGLGYRDYERRDEK